MARKKENIETRLRRAIERAPITRYRLSKISGVAEGVLCRFVKGQRTITLTTAAKLADALGLELFEKENRETE